MPATNPRPRLPILPILSVLAAFGIALAGFSAPAGAGEDQAQASFAKFARSWVSDLEREAEDGREGAKRFVSYDPSDVEVSLSPTGNDAAPYVGTLTYTQETYQCRTSAQKNCQVVDTESVTEIFPYQGGRWRY